MSEDAQAIVLLCSSLGARRDDSSAKPLGPRTWHKVQGRLIRHGVGGPAALMETSSDGIEDLLEVGPVEAARVSQLLSRRGQLAFELERLRGRGLWVLTIVDASYPSRLRDRLSADAPPLLFGAGDQSKLGAGGVAIVGSRDADVEAIKATEHLAGLVADIGQQVVSGGARGIDSWAMRTAFAHDGSVVGVLPEGVEHRMRDPENRRAIEAGRAVLLSPYRPDAPFSAGAAMGRNKIIYAMADIAIVISSAADAGGTWTGAVEALGAGWIPVHVRSEVGVPEGNSRLLTRGALPLNTLTVTEAQLSSMVHAVVQVSSGSGTLPLPEQASLFGDQDEASVQPRHAKATRSR